MINDSLQGTVTGGLNVTDALDAGPLNNLTGSPLLYNLWFNNPAVVNLENNPTAGNGTGTFKDTNNVETVWIDPAIYPGAPPVTVNGEPTNFASQNINQLAERIGHELAHAEFPDGDVSYVNASNLGQAVAIGEMNEGVGYTVQYIIAEQLSDLNTTNLDNTSFKGLNKIFAALQAVAARYQPVFLTLNTIADVISSPFYQAAVGTLDALGPVSLAITSLQSQAGANGAFTQLDKWQDQWILANVYNMTTGAYSYSLRNLTHSCITVKSDGHGGGTFAGNNIQITVKNLVLPDGNQLNSRATLSFLGGSDSTIPGAANSGISQGEYTISAAAGNGLPAETLLYGGNGGPTSYTLTGLKGTDWFFVQQLSSSSSGTVTLAPPSSLFGHASGAGGILVDGFGIGGSAGQQLQTEAQAGHFNWSVDGKGGGYQYVYDNSKQTLTVTNTNLWGSTSVVVDKFNLAAAESSSGFLGIFLRGTLQLSSGANAGSGASTPNFAASSTQSYSLSVDVPSAAAQTITVTLRGAMPSDFQAIVGGVSESINADGTFSVTLAAGKTSVSFQLRDTTAGNPHSDLANGAPLQLSASVPSSIGAPIQATPLTFNYIPQGADTAPAPHPTDVISGTFSSATGVTSYTGDTGDDYFAATGTANLINAQSSHNDIFIGGSQTNTIYGGNGNSVYTLDGTSDWVALGSGFNTVSASSGGQDVISQGAGDEDFIGNGGTAVVVLGNGNSQIYAGTQTSITDAIAAQATARASGTKGDFIGIGDGNNSIVGGLGNDLISVGDGNDLIVMGPGNDTFVGGSETSSATVNWSTSVTKNGGYTLTEVGIGAYEKNYVNSFPQPYNGNSDIGVPFGSANDTIFGGNGNEFFELGNGNNYVETGNGNDTVLGGMGNDTIIAGSGSDTIRGGGGTTYIAGGSGTEFIEGGDGNNTIIGGSGNSTILAANGPTGSTLFTGANLVQNYVFGGSAWISSKEVPAHRSFMRVTAGRARQRPPWPDLRAPPRCMEGLALTSWRGDRGARSFMPVTAGHRPHRRRWSAGRVSLPCTAARARASCKISKPDRI